MREFIIRDWKAQESAADSESEAEDEAEDRGKAEEVRPPPPPAAPRPDETVAPAIAEPEDQTLGGAIRVKRFPAATTPISRSGDEPRPAVRESKAGSPSQRKRGERQFIIAYDGVFVGFFEAAEEVTPREAFKRVAQDLAEDESFDPEKLSLYKPVLLRSARPARGVNVIRGKMARLSWQPKKATLVPNPEASDGAPGGEGEVAT